MAALIVLRPSLDVKSLDVKSLDVKSLELTVCAMALVTFGFC
ncbi:MAG: hypothetical protein WA858_28500 [Xanthobacteraceae bacterium]